MTKPMTERQQRVYDYIRERIASDGYGPSIREIADAMGFRSPNGVICHLTALEKKGLIRRDSNKSRSIVLTEDAADAPGRGLPLAGRVAAGGLMEAIEQEETIDLGDLWDGTGSFVLEVTGDSMIDAHILDGDYVVIRQQSTADPGDIVVARTGEGEATLKYWFPEKNRIRLQPANKRLKPIHVRDAQVVGVVVGVVRPM